MRHRVALGFGVALLLGKLVSIAAQHQGTSSTYCPDRWDWQTKRPEDMGTDMTFSASKSYLATVAGLALDRGLIRSVDDPVKNYVDDGTFDSPHNSKITWRHLLNHEIAARQRASDEKRKAETERQQGAMASQSTVAVQ